MAAKPKTCGQCAHTESGGTAFVWCYGLPPAVISARPNDVGGMEVTIQAVPLVANDRRPCSLFKAKPR